MSYSLGGFKITKLIHRLINWVEHRYPKISKFLHLQPLDYLIQGDRSKKFSDPTVFCDIDGTLVIWHMDTHPNAITFDNYGNKVKLVPHKQNIEELKLLCNKGYKIIVWSAAGSEWAKEVVKKLKLTKYVSLTISKPEFFIDDLKSDMFLPEKQRVFKEFIDPMKIEVKAI